MPLPEQCPGCGRDIVRADVMAETTLGADVSTRVVHLPCDTVLMRRPSREECEALDGTPVPVRLPLAPGGSDVTVTVSVPGTGCEISWGELVDAMLERVAKYMDT